MKQLATNFGDRTLSRLFNWNSMVQETAHALASRSPRFRFNPGWLLFTLVFAFFLPVQMRADSILNSKHNLSVSGTGTIKAMGEREICIFCHTPHRAGVEQPLWNHSSSTAVYTPYSSSTLKASVGQPDGASKLCLSCHDGTVALGKINSRTLPITMQGAVTTMPTTSRSNLGTDLSRDHPISFIYNSALASANGKLADPGNLSKPVRLDHNGKMQCTACHNPHDDQYGNFLVMQNTNAELCAVCHTDPGWAGSAHQMSTLPLTPVVAAALSARTSASRSTTGAAASSPTKHFSAKTVGTNSCNNCHATHTAGGRKQLLLSAREEQLCFACHNGSVVRQNLESEFNKVSTHPVLQTSQLHDSGENLVNAPRHVACADCHNSHAAKSASLHLAKNTTAKPVVSPALAGVKGVNRFGTLVNSVTHEYELCFRCHGDNQTPAPAATRNLIESKVSRIASEPSMRQQFNPSNRSYHPVVAIGKNTNVPSLLPPYTVGSTIQCTDCHNNDQGPGAGGAGPNGPHGSAFAPLLERRLLTTDQTMESAANYALCYKCHSRDSILSDQSFRATSSSGKDRGHRFHIVDQKTACATCHDSHGVANNKGLINFNPLYVTRGSNGRIEYLSTGLFRGNCTLSCHGSNHLGTSYPDATGVSQMRNQLKK